jgi:hypothetical protein
LETNKRYAGINKRYAETNKRYVKIKTIRLKKINTGGIKNVSVNSDLIRAIVDAVLPSGAAWEYKERGDLSKLYDGIADNAGEVQDFLSTLAYVRDPQLTSVLDDLEKDYDVKKDPNLNEQQRRDYLSSVFPRRTAGTAEYMQDQLRLATGSNEIYVTRNSSINYQSWTKRPLFNGESTYFGNEKATFTAHFFIPQINPTWLDVTMFGRQEAQFGRQGVQFEAPKGRWIINGNDQDAEFSACLDSCEGFWAGVFFVGGEPEYESGTGNISSIPIIDIDLKFKKIIERVVLQNKPFHTWAYELINYI